MGKEEIKSIGILIADMYLHFPMITDADADDLVEFLKDNYIEYEGATDIVMDLEKENKQLKSILTELEEWLKEEKERYYGELGMHQKILIEKVLDKMQELENGDNNE